MSKSAEWCINRVKNNEKSLWKDRDWDNAREMNSGDMLKQIYTQKDINHNEIYPSHWYLAKDGKYIEVFLEILPESDDFDYFTSSQSIHDGTLLFEMETIQNTLMNILKCQTYNADLKLPKWGDKIKYTIGNLVILNEFNGDWVPKDKPYLRERTSVLLPVKFEYLEGDE